MATNNSIDSNIPIELSKGGINATSMATSKGVIYYDSSGLATVASVGTAGQVLKSTGASSPPEFQDGGSSDPVTVAFLANLSSDITNVTGDGTQYSVAWDNEVYDIGGDFNPSTGVFTAPSTSKYYFISCVAIVGSSVNKGYDSMISTTGGDFVYSGCLSDERSIESGDTFENSVAKIISVLTAMDAGDTTVSKVASYDSGSADNDIAATSASYFCGYEPN